MFLLLRICESLQKRGPNYMPEIYGYLIIPSANNVLLQSSLKSDLMKAYIEKNLS